MTTICVCLDLVFDLYGLLLVVQWDPDSLVLLIKNTRNKRANSMASSLQCYIYSAKATHFFVGPTDQHSKKKKPNSQCSSESFYLLLTLTDEFLGLPLITPNRWIRNLKFPSPTPFPPGWSLGSFVSIFYISFVAVGGLEHLCVCVCVRVCVCVCGVCV